MDSATDNNNDRDHAASTFAIVVLIVLVVIVTAVVLYIILRGYQRRSTRPPRYDPSGNVMIDVINQRKRLFSSPDVI